MVQTNFFVFMYPALLHRVSGLKVSCSAGPRCSYSTASFPKPLKGTHDLYGSAMDTYRYLVESARNITNLYGFSEVGPMPQITELNPQIATPIIEDTSLFQRTLGDSDVVNKEMYTFSSRAGVGSISLRPENTAGNCFVFAQL